jgi:hypothetical protein
MVSYGLLRFGCLKINGPINFVQNYQDGSSNCPEQNGIKNWGVASHKKITLFLWKDLKTSLVLLGLRFIPLKYPDNPNKPQYRYENEHVFFCTRQDRW